ncbi:AAEL004448-PA [Aedes aegypti]|uniref:Torsin n=2 Tax=Aedes aegypti TaxID=7159 RepID=A0A1S4F7S7_AEDAE|nr:torsin-like protein isoform X3 [Aedes aegypti]EAT44169.1 AAEL004448-PA [Aedes aegypti]
MWLARCVSILAFAHFAVVPYCDAVEPVTVSVVAGLTGLVSSAGWFGKDFLLDNTYCKFTECCRKPYIKADVAALKASLKGSLYGQHIVQDVLVNAIGAHYDNIENSRKPLVMSFHGTPGTGKNYVSDFVAAALYKNGISSKFVYKYTASDLDTDLAASVKQTVKNCPYSLFIFDEIERMPTGVFDSIVSLLDHHSALKGFDFTKSIFIFLSNSAGIEIAKKLKSLMDDGSYRDQTKLSDFERIAELAAYNLIGGLYRSGVIESHVIDHFVPFLPLEPRHVLLCIKKELQLQQCPETSENDIKKIMDEAMTPDKTEQFSNNGCKRLSKKVEAFCYQRRLKHNYNNKR